MTGWQEFYTPKPRWWQRLLARTVCKIIGHTWSEPGCHPPEGEPCVVCGYNSVQLN
jgi:hypothetical protein